jgi:superoxide reductase
MIRDKGAAVCCCGEKMQNLIPGTTEASSEKHIPVYDLEGNTVHVCVGAAEHPMSREHYIEWI